MLSIPGKRDIPVFSTDEINISSPNITTPYREHKGVLLQFYTRLSVMDMMLIADSCRTKTVPTAMFEVPEGFKDVPRAKMEKVLDELFK